MSTIEQQRVYAARRKERAAALTVWANGQAPQIAAEHEGYRDALDNIANDGTDAVQKRLNIYRNEQADKPIGPVLDYVRGAQTALDEVNTKCHASS